MSSLKEQLAAANAQIEALEEERRRIYADSHVDDDEHPRLTAINHELEHLWISNAGSKRPSPPG
jgi:hypothetical protein